MTTRTGMLAVAGLLAALTLLITGCRSGGPEGRAEAAQSSGEAPIRTDPQPLIDEFPALGGLGEVHWQGGRLGDDRVPGPSTYYIKAAMTLPPDELARLSTRYAFMPATTEPQPPPELVPFLDGAGPWSSSAELDQELSTQGWPTQLHVRLDSGVAYLSAMSH
jgi:hypothetical protein